MADPLILEVTGVEIEIRFWRGTDNSLLVTCLKSDGDPLNLTNYDVTLKLMDRPVSAGGVVKYTQTNAGPGGHSTPTEGKTIMTIPASATSALTETRPYTWKYQVTSRERTTGQLHVHFFGDARILSPAAPVS